MKDQVHTAGRAIVQALLTVREEETKGEGDTDFVYLDLCWYLKNCKKKNSFAALGEKQKVLESKESTFISCRCHLLGYESGLTRSEAYKIQLSSSFNIYTLELKTEVK